MKALFALLALCCGIAQAQTTYIGPPISPPAGSPYIAGVVNGSLAWSAVDVSNGPLGTPGWCGMGFRITTETNLNPTFVQRCASYTWEGNNTDEFGIDWMALLTRRGFSAGLHNINDSPWPYPLDRLEVRAARQDENHGCMGENGHQCAYTGRRPTDGDYAYLIGLLPITCPGSHDLCIAVRGNDGSKVPALICPLPLVSGQPVCKLLLAP